MPAKRSKKLSRRAQLAALRKETAHDTERLIRLLLAKPPVERMNFLRKRVGIAATCL